MIVLDASALLDVALRRPSAAWLLDRMSAGDLVAPAHQPAEVLSAVGRLERAGELSADDARMVLDDAMSLPQELVAPDTALVHRAFALRGRIRPLDGLYVALAERVGAPLLTTDLRLARGEPPCTVLAPP